ncbi:hypothetical protein ACFSQ5_10135 [Enterococcus gallinarum]|nr:hypothetical protein RV03_GL000137 [Enterococcus gallinarum]
MIEVTIFPSTVTKKQPNDFISAKEQGTSHNNIHIDSVEPLA